jgi:indole-3-glycerol phosphate synthase
MSKSKMPKISENVSTPESQPQFLKFHQKLQEILSYKQTEVAELHTHWGISHFQAMCKEVAAPRGFIQRLKSDAQNGAAIIAEIKKASPSVGVIREHFDPIAIAKDYALGGASCISVLCDEKFFQGKPEYLQSVRPVVDCPLLWKDFIFDPIQVVRARAYGADAALLIVAALSDDLLKKLWECVQSQGMDALVEVHNESELKRAIALGAQCIGVNNRDLKTFHVNLEASHRLSAYFPPNIVRISESGISSREDVESLQGSGYNCFLIGESLMRDEDPITKLQNLRGIG